MQTYSIEQSGAFVEMFELPPTGDGPLAGLRFAVKDLIDVRGKPTGCGNATWLKTHPVATDSAVCVEQLLASGATCVGKTVTDELAFSLGGENHFYGTPLNPAAPERVPGGSSSGSASAVACGLVDFALGTDTGGSVRIPASNCGLFGIRPSHGRVSLAGVMPFAPSFDTVGILARDADAFCRAARVLLAAERAPVAERGSVHLVSEAFALADAAVREALQPAIACLRTLVAGRVRETSLGALCDLSEAGDLATWLDTFSVLQWAEIQSSLGAWIAETRPEFGPQTAANFEMVRQLDRTRIAAAAYRREEYCGRLRRALAGGDLVCLPTAPSIAPLKGEIRDRRGDYYRRTLSLTAIAGVGRLAQVTLPVAKVAAAPIGLSLLIGPGDDARLLDVAGEFARAWHEAAHA
jgi:amidase